MLTIECIWMIHANNLGWRSCVCCGHVWETSRSILHSNAAPYALWMLEHPRDHHAAVLDLQSTHLSSWATSWLKRRCGYSVKKCFERNIIEQFPSHGLTGYVGFPCRFCRQPKSKPLLMPFLTRTCALVLLETVLRGAWTVEQPNGSVLEFYPTWRTVMRNIFVVGGIGAVPRCTPSSLTTFLKAIPPPTKYQSPMIYVSLISI